MKLRLKPKATAPALSVLLKSAREGKSLSLREVEKATGVSNPQISQWESGRCRNPGIHGVLVLAKFYGIPLPDLEQSVLKGSDEAEN